MTNPDRVAFTLFGRDIYWYGVLMALGIVIAIFIANREGKRKNLPKDSIIDMCLIIIPCGVIGARLYYVLMEWQNYASNPISVLYIWEGGLAIYGAVIGGLIGAFIYSRVKKIRFLKLADCIAPGLVLAQSIGRWGNFFNQEAFGNPVTNPDLWWFPFSVKIDRLWQTVPGYHTFNGVACDNPYHLATFFYESVWCFFIFLFIWLRRKKFKHDGDAFLWYGMLYAFERMFVEGLRGDSLWLVQPSGEGLLSGGIRVSQLLSIILFAGILAFMSVRHFKEKKLHALIWPSPEVVVEAEKIDAETDETTVNADANETEGENADDAGKASVNADADDAEEITVNADASEAEEEKTADDETQEAEEE